MNFFQFLVDRIEQKKVFKSALWCAGWFSGQKLFFFAIFSSFWASFTKNFTFFFCVFWFQRTRKYTSLNFFRFKIHFYEFWFLRNFDIFFDNRKNFSTCSVPISTRKSFSILIVVELKFEGHLLPNMVNIDRQDYDRRLFIIQKYQENVFDVIFSVLSISIKA